MSAMGHLNAFVSPEYPVFYTLIPGGEETDGVPDGSTGVAIAILVEGTPTFLTTHVVDDAEVSSVAHSLESGDVRVTVVGMPIKVSGDDDEAPVEHHPGAFLSLLCDDGRRMTVARILGSDRSQSPRALARYLIRQISKGVQITALAASG